MASAPCYNVNMKKLKNIFAALSTLRRIPSTTIESGWKSIRQMAASATDNDTGELVVDAGVIALFDSLIDAVVAIAKDDEDKSTAAGKADKP